MFTGTAKPWLAVELNELLLDAAVSMPITCPALFDQRSAGVSGLDGGVGLEQAAQLLGGAGALRRPR